MLNFLNKLKSIYLSGKANRSIDDLLHFHLKIEEDQFFHFMDKMKTSPLNRLLDIKEIKPAITRKDLKFDLTMYR